MHMAHENESSFYRTSVDNINYFSSENYNNTFV